jgi:hypothetical protein
LPNRNRANSNNNSRNRSNNGNGQRKEKAPNFTKAEDLLICKAFVNVSTDATVGNDQTAERFWERICDKFKELLKEAHVLNDQEVMVDDHGRTPNSIMNRFQRHIQKAVNKYNHFYKQVKDTKPSGHSEEDIRKLAADEYRTANSQVFKWLHCIETLHQLAKFDPMTNDNDDAANGEEGEPNYNRVGAVMGDTLERPSGQKAAKRQKVEEATLVSIQTERLETQRALSGATQDLASSIKMKVMNDKTRHKRDEWFRQAQFFQSIGDIEQAREYMTLIKQDQEREALEEQKEREAMEQAQQNHDVPGVINAANQPSPIVGDQASVTSSGHRQNTQEAETLDVEDEDEDEASNMDRDNWCNTPFCTGLVHSLFGSSSRTYAT